MAAGVCRPSGIVLLILSEYAFRGIREISLSFDFQRGTYSHYL